MAIMAPPFNEWFLLVFPVKEEPVMKRPVKLPVTVVGVTVPETETPESTTCPTSVAFRCCLFVSVSKDSLVAKEKKKKKIFLQSYL